MTKAVSLQMRNFYLAGVAAAAFAVPSVARASEEDSSASTTAVDTPAAPQDKADVIDDVGSIVVTARKRVERLIDVPIAATAVGEQEIRRYNITSFADVRFAAPQVSFERAYSGSGASVVIRGISSSAVDSALEQSVLLDIDGMPVSRGRIFNDALFDLEGIDVLKGPQALYFGKNAPAGVASIRSAGPGDALNGFVRAGYEFSSRGTSMEGAVGGPVSDTVGLRVAVFASNSDGYLHNNAGAVSVTQSGNTYIVQPGPSRLGGERKLAGRLTFTYTPTSELRMTAKVLGSDYRGEGLASLLEVMSCPAGQTSPTSFGQVDPFGDCSLNNHNSNGWLPRSTAQAWTQLSGNGNFDVDKPTSYNKTFLPTLRIDYSPGSVDLTSVTGYYYYSFGTTANQDATAFTKLHSTQVERNKTFYQEVRGLTKFKSPLNFVFGGYYEHNSRDLESGSLITYVPADPATGRQEAFDFVAKNSGWAWSVFGQAILKFGQIELNTGARYAKEQKAIDLANIYVNPANLASYKPVGVHVAGSRIEDNVSPEATLTYHLSRDVMIYGAYKTGYLSGGFSNPGNVSPALTLQRNTYSNEKATGFEGGLKFSLRNGMFSGSVTGYNYKFSGLQLTSYDVALNTFFTRNAAAARTRGIEVEGRMRLPSGFSIFGTGAYNDAYFISFPNAQCYFNQTAAQGCMTVPGTSVKVQDQSGQPLSRAPKWIFTLGSTYDREISEDLKLRVSADIRTTSHYYANVNLNPASLQKGYTMLNGSVALGQIDDKWTVSLIGRNLTDRHYATVAQDKPGGVGEIETIAPEPRAVVLQIGTRF